MNSIDDIYKMCCVSVLKIYLATDQMVDHLHDFKSIFKKLSDSKNKENQALALLAKRV